MSSSQQMKIGAIMSYVMVAVNIITGLFYTPWMISSIGRENFGLYTLAMSVISLFVFDFGLSSAVTRFISKYLAEGKKEKANQCMGLVYRLYFIIDIILLVLLTVVFFFIPDIYKELTPDEISQFKVIYVMVAFYSVVSFPFIPVNGVLTAYEKFIQLKLCDLFHKLFIVVAMSVCLLYGQGLYALVIVNVVSGLLTILLKLWVIKSKTTQKIDYHYFNKQEFRQILGFSGWVTVISLAQRCIFNLAPSILGALSGSTAIAILGIATTLEGYTYTFANAINGMFLPKVSRIVANEGGDVLPLMIRIGRIQIYIVSLVVFGVLCFGSQFISLWVGDGFHDSYQCAVLIILPSFLHLPQMIGSETIYAANKVRHMAIVFIVMAICNLVGAAILAPVYGAAGICLSVFIAYLVRTVGMDIIFYRELHIDIWKFFRESYLKIMLPLLLSIAFGVAVSKMLPSDSWIWLCVQIGVFVLGYCVVMYLFAMNKSEKDLLLKPIIRYIR